jgi:hypothetical protein
LRKSEVEKLHLVIGDLSLALAEKKNSGHPNATIALDILIKVKEASDQQSRYSSLVCCQRICILRWQRLCGL